MLTNERERFSSTFLFSPTSTYMTEGERESEWENTRHIAGNKHAWKRVVRRWCDLCIGENPRHGTKKHACMVKGHQRLMWLTYSTGRQNSLPVTYLSWVWHILTWGWVVGRSSVHRVASAQKWRELGHLYQEHRWSLDYFPSKSSQKGLTGFPGSHKHHPGGGKAVLMICSGKL